MRDTEPNIIRPTSTVTRLISIVLKESYLDTPEYKSTLVLVPEPQSMLLR